MGSTSRGENSINKTEEEEECEENDGDDGDEAMNVEIANDDVNDDDDDENRVGGRNETFGDVRQSGNDTDVVMDATGS